MAGYGNYRSDNVDYQGTVNRHAGLPPAGAHVLDRRLELADKEFADEGGLFRGRRVLDVGCNCGRVVGEAALHYSASSVTGIDKDPSLIQQAESHISFLYSRLKPSSPPDPNSSIANTNDADTKTYFPISSVLDHGHRRRPEPPPPARQGDAPGFPFNVSFRTEDWSLPPPPPPPPQAAQTDPPTYDVLLALSVLKWIHILSRDEGVASFFRRCRGSLAPGGRLVLEIQPWGSYEKAVKKMGKAAGAGRGGGVAADVLGGLEVRPEAFGGLLEEVGFLRERVLEGEGLPRRIEIWRRV
ncbi:hypothetical protein FGG08_000973 [Glutinoglossum americanum]|uniref:RNA methyltransferase n=1 Tax=Glutinoglossum americanum TaxID=1670608 RepID=A0A9P8ICC0_9PEZI|nr:hypothetical protein FGG08_000973 [Glutinoglossum americanum]